MSTKNTKVLNDTEKIDKEIAEIEKANEKKREHIEDEQRATAQREALVAKQIQLANLQTESARLDVKLAEVTRANSIEDITAGAASPLAAARAEMEAMQARAASDTITTETAVTVTEPEQLESDSKEK